MMKTTRYFGLRRHFFADQASAVLQNSPSKNRGFSLIEAMVVISIVAVLAAIGIPSYNNLVKNNCMVNNVNLFLNTLKLARDAAITTKTRIIVFPSEPADNGVWSDGWGNGWEVVKSGAFLTPMAGTTFSTGTLCPGSTIVESTQDRKGLVARTSLLPPIRWVTHGRPKPNAYLVYEGRTGNVLPSSVFHFCDDRTGETGREVTVHFNGTATTQKMTCS